MKGNQLQQALIIACSFWFTYEIDLNYVSLFIAHIWCYAGAHQHQQAPYHEAAVSGLHMMPKLNCFVAHVWCGAGAHQHHGEGP